jgi:hypothetical protein
MQHLCGWRHDPREVERMALPEHAAPPANDSNTLLYLFARKVIGSDLPKGPQGIGDCVSWGWGNARNLLSCVEIALKGEAEKYVECATESIYALSRVEVGGELGSYEDGSVGAWAAKAVSTYGTLGRDVVGPYDPKRAKEWGAKGLSPDLETKAKDHLIKTVTLVRSAEEAARMIDSGYPVPVCSNQGFSMTRDQQGFCRPSGSWAHCMCFIAVRRGGRPGLCCLQSWGVNTPTGPLDLEQPDNSFWVDFDVADRMLRMEDSFAASAFDGYPDRRAELTWSH